MRAALIAVALLLTGCAGEAAGPAPTTQAAQTTTTQAADTAAEQAYLADLGGELLGDYPGPELVALGYAFCRNREAGRDPYAGGETPGDGTFRYPVVSVPVWASDAIYIDIAARRHFCLGA